MGAQNNDDDSCHDDDGDDDGDGDGDGDDDEEEEDDDDDHDDGEHDGRTAHKWKKGHWMLFMHVLHERARKVETQKPSLYLYYRFYMISPNSFLRIIQFSQFVRMVAII